MFGVKLNEAKTMFFDRPKVMRSMDDATQKALSRFGAFVWRRSRSSIRKRKKTSEPGQPPSSHTDLYKKNIYFGYNAETRSVVIGPIRLNRGAEGMPEALERGGESTIKTISGRKMITKKVRIRPRPAMQLAFEKELPKAAPQFKDSMRGP